MKGISLLVTAVDLHPSEYQSDFRVWDLSCTHTALRTRLHTSSTFYTSGKHHLVWGWPGKPQLCLEQRNGNQPDCTKLLGNIFRLNGRGRYRKPLALCTDRDQMLGGPLGERMRRFILSVFGARNRDLNMAVWEVGLQPFDISLFVSLSLSHFRSGGRRTLLLESPQDSCIRGGGTSRFLHVLYLFFLSFQYRSPSNPSILQSQENHISTCMKRWPTCSPALPWPSALSSPTPPTDKTKAPDGVVKPGHALALTPTANLCLWLCPFVPPPNNPERAD